MTKDDANTALTCQLLTGSSHFRSGDFCSCQKANDCLFEPWERNRLRHAPEVVAADDRNYEEYLRLTGQIPEIAAKSD